MFYHWRRRLQLGYQSRFHFRLRVYARDVTWRFSGARQSSTRGLVSGMDLTGAALRFTSYGRGPISTGSYGFLAFLSLVNKHVMLRKNYRRSLTLIQRYLTSPLFATMIMRTRTLTVGLHLKFHIENDAAIHE